MTLSADLNRADTLSLRYVCLEPHASARSKASARHEIAVGTTVLSVAALSTALYPAEQRRRCDYCHRVPSGSDRLLKCSGCAAFWYCGTICQTRQWQDHHRRICKRYNRFVTSPEYQTLSSGDKADALLLSQLLIQLFPTGAGADTRSAVGDLEQSDPVSIFFDLQKGPCVSARNIPLCKPANSLGVPPDIVDDIYSRFGNNNFVVHSHLTSYAHGIFPLASRLFNHSCIPNCATKYVITPGEPVKMEIVALRAITSGEEITVPYLDPALPLQTRQSALRANYGFNCMCPLCTFQQTLGPVVPLPSDSKNIRAVEDSLCEYVTSHILQLDPYGIPPSAAETSPGSGIPSELFCLLNADYLPSLSETFSRSSHEGNYEIALASGRTLLAFYAAIYPRNYPQIGMHALELSKTAWNASITRNDDVEASHPPPAVTKLLEDRARHYLTLAAEVMQCFGPEGDEGGPLEEIRIMRELLQGTS